MLKQEAYGFDNLADIADVELERDALALFTRQNEGHMGKWEYGSSLYAGDPAGGADLWAQMVCRPSGYYVAQADIKLVKWAVRQDIFKTYFGGIRTIMEFGPGSEDIVLQKTLPLLRSSPDLTSYFALDISRDFADKTAALVTQNLGVRAKGVKHDFSKPFLRRSEGNAAFVVLGSTISNLECKGGKNPFHALMGFFKNLRQGMAGRDILLITFDTAQDAEKVLCAYSGVAARKHGINLIYRLKRDGIGVGDFDPDFWCYEPVWLPKTFQCCHTVFPIIDQTIRIQGFEIRIPAYRRYILNNSYKFSSEFVVWAAQVAGYKDCRILMRHHMGMLLARA